MPDKVVLHEWQVTLTLVLKSGERPDKWDWDELLDLSGNEEIVLEECVYLGSEQKEIEEPY